MAGVKEHSINAAFDQISATNSRLFCWCVRKWHVLDAILLLRCYVAMFVFIDHVYVLLEVSAGVGLFLDGYEESWKGAS